MPIYEYLCQNCGHELEAIQKVSDPPLKRCPECGKNKLTKEISQSSFAFKGSGWYVSDYAGKSGSKKDKESGSKSDSDAKSSGSSAAA